VVVAFTVELFDPDPEETVEEAVCSIVVVVCFPPDERATTATITTITTIAPIAKVVVFAILSKRKAAAKYLYFHVTHGNTTPSTAASKNKIKQRRIT
jgi:hypothetical protein